MVLRTTLQVVTPPPAESVSLQLAKLHCRIDHSDDDLLLGGHITAARQMAESYLSRALITQTLLWTVLPENAVRPDLHFLSDWIDLPRAPVQSINTVTVLDQRGNSTEIAAAALPLVPPAPLLGYMADLALSPARMMIGAATALVDGRTLRQTALQHVQVEFTAGYGSPAEPPAAAVVAAIPQPIISAILLTVGHLYENRGDAVAELPPAAQWLLDPYRIMWA